MSKERICQLYAGKTAVPVTEAIYRAYHKENEHAKYVDRQARAHECAYQAVAGPEISAEDWLDRLSGGQPPEIGRAARSARLEEALSILDPVTREALWQVVCREASVQEIACEWQVSRSTVYRRLRRACTRLRLVLTEEDD